jgi:hypothetical protein
VSQTKAQLLDGSVVSVAFSAGSVGAPSLYFTGDTNTGIYSPGADQIAFVEGGVEALRIDSSGRLLVGISSSRFSRFNTSDFQSSLQIESDLEAAQSITRWSTGTNCSRLHLQKGRGTIASPAVIANNDLFGEISFSGYDSANMTNGARISAEVDGTPGANDMPGRLVFSTTADGAASPTERMRIDSSGRLLVGTSTARSNFFNTSIYSPIFQIEGANSEPFRFLSLTYGKNDASGPILVLSKHRSNSVGGNTIVQSGDEAGQISFQTSDGTDFVEVAGISANIDGTPGANDMPGRLVFSTTADGAASPTERMRINSTGAVLVGNTTQFSVNSTTATGVQLTSVGELVSFTDNTVAAYFGRQTSDGSLISFRRSGAGVGTISVTTSATAYNTTSDYRLKENLEPITGAAARILQLKPSRFNFIVDPDHTVDGFIAHEAQAVVPECVTGEKDAVDDDGKPVYQGIDQSKLVPLLTAALQEAIAKIETLEARLTAAGIE